MSGPIQNVVQTVLHTCKSCTSSNKNKNLFRGTPTKNKTTRATKMEAKKVNNMPNLQSVSQAKGYGRLHKKPSQSEPCSNEIDRNTLISRSIIYPITFILGLKLITMSPTGSEWYCSYLRE